MQSPALSVPPLVSHRQHLNSRPALLSSSTVVISLIKPSLTRHTVRPCFSEKQFWSLLTREASITTVYPMVWHELRWTRNPAHKTSSHLLHLTSHLVLPRAGKKVSYLSLAYTNKNIKSCWSTAWKTAYKIHNQRCYNYDFDRQENLASYEILGTTLLASGYIIRNRTKLSFFFLWRIFEFGFLPKQKENSKT